MDGGQAEAAVNPDIALIDNLADKFGPELYEFIKANVEAQDKRSMMVLKCYKATEDISDFVDSVRKLHAKQKKQ